MFINKLSRAYNKIRQLTAGTVKSNFKRTAQRLVAADIGFFIYEFSQRNTSRFETDFT